MASSSKNNQLNEQYADLIIEEESLEEGIIIEEDEAEEPGIDLRWSVVGRVLSDKLINPNAFKQTLAAIWKPIKGVCIKELEPLLFLFQFFQEVNVRRVLDDGPWSFDNQLIVIQCVQVGDQPRKIPLFTVQFWVQIYDLPTSFWSEKVGKEIVNFIGNYVKTDPNNFGGLWKNYMRIRVELNVRKPLKNKMKIKRTGGEWVWLAFQYERLPQFCYLCGVLSHGDKFYRKLLDEGRTFTEKPYGPSMRAK